MYTINSYQILVITSFSLFSFQIGSFSFWKLSESLKFNFTVFLSPDNMNADFARHKASSVIPCFWDCCYTHHDTNK
jgi:hypothetical protein